ncbi:MAG: hypothetical protein ACPG77_06800 [Nannocystaceae bacterium]
MTLRTYASSLALVGAVSLLGGCFNDDGRGDDSASEGSDTSDQTSTSNDLSTDTASSSEATSAGTTDPAPTAGNMTEDPSTSATSGPETTETTETETETSESSTTNTPSTTDPSTTSEPTSDPTTSSDTDDPTMMGIACEDPGLGDCNANEDDGCETDLDHSQEHCGACDNPCDGMCVEGDCKPGRLVFVTADKYTGDLGGLEGADQKCKEAAENANLPGEYKAWLSTSADDPASRFTHSQVPYLLVSGLAIAENWDDLVDGALNLPINVTEHGLFLPQGNVCESEQAWSSTDANGVALLEQLNCDKWTSAENSMEGRFGLAGATNTMWSNGMCEDIFILCSVPRRLYCFAQ